MRLTLLIVVMSTFSLFAQITITGEDVEAIFAVGNATIIHQDTLQSNIDIGNPGGGNIWNFSTLQSNLTVDFTSVNPSSTPYYNDFPGTSICTHFEGFSQGYDAEIWTYSSLSNFINNHGSATTISAFPGTVLTIKNDPPRQTYIDPMTFNSQWTETYLQTTLLNGTPLSSENVSLSVIVDAYGTMTMPGGVSYDALRIRESLTIAGITSVTYSFLAINGVQVALSASSSNPPNSGIIDVDEYSWNSEFSGAGLDLVINYPDSSSVLIAGESNLIVYANWEGGIDLFYSLDNGENFEVIDSNYFSLVGQYYWNVPDSFLSRMSIIKIVDSSPDTALSKIFKIKPWQLTRLDVNDDFELYEPDQDGWSFCNCPENQWPMSWWQQFNYSGTDPKTGNAYPNQSPFSLTYSSDFPDWPLFVDVFSISQCYTDDPPSIYNSAATTKWRAKYGRWGGSCFGFAVSSLFGFYNEQTLSQYIGTFDQLFDEDINDDTRYVINLLQNYQYGKESSNNVSIKWNSTPRQLLSELKQMLGQDNVDGKTLGFWNNNGSGGHAVVPYKMERIGNTSTFNVKLYNSNAPGDLNNFIFIDSVANTWSDSTGLGWGTGSSHCLLNLDNSDFLSIQTLDRQNSLSSPTSDYSGFSRLEINNTPNAEIIITSGTGEQIGYQDSVWFNNINDAIPLIPLTGGFHPPIGYDVPEDSYSLELNNFVDTTSYVLFFTDSTIYTYSRFSANSSQSDKLNFSENGINITNPDPVIKNINFEAIIREDTTSEKVFVTNNIQVSSGDSIHFQEKNRNELLFQNYGDAMSYDLQARFASANGGSVFFHMSIPMAQNSAHQIVPEWTDLNNEPVSIFIDLGNDGTFDDTIFVKNQATNIEDEGSLLSPDSYNLAQNYPNPFNPTTTIKYSVPQRSNVEIKVYDILGKEILTLVNEEKFRGVYSVTFNASGLSSGIYFYRMQSGNFVKTKKMLILK